MAFPYRHGRPTIGALAGWQFYRTATNLSYLAPIFRGMSRAAQALDCNLMLGCGIGPSASPQDPLRPAWPVPARDQDFVPIGPWNTDGLLVAIPLHSQARSNYIQGLRAAGHPVLFIGSGENGPTIMADNSGGIQEAMQHLVNHGHRKIAFIAGSEDDLRGDSGQRLAAYRSACDRFELEQDARLLVYGQHVYNGGFLGMQQILSSGAAFTALLASNDESALGAMDALKQAGYRIPDDVAVIGFDNRLEGAVYEPGLTSIHAPLYNIGYRAVELLLQKITGNTDLPELVQMDTNLVVRQSCGCGLTKGSGPACEVRLPAADSGQRQELAHKMAGQIQKQAYNLEEAECEAMCLRLVETFSESMQNGDPGGFQQALADVLQRTAAGEDDTHIWQDAVSLLETSLDHDAWPQACGLLDDARLEISAQMQRQHREFVMHERWITRCLSLLTARLQTSLDTQQIYTVLSRHLPEMNMHTALLGTFETEDGDPFARSVIRNALQPSQHLANIRSQEFPSGCLADDQPFILTLIPIMSQAGQLGFMVFDTNQLNVYGSIVQQLGGAFNTARLYREATEARRTAEEANRMKSRFLSTISHELRTPLNLIVGLSGVMLQESDEGNAILPDSTRKDIERVQAYAQHLGGLIGDVLDLTSNDAGQLRLIKITWISARPCALWPKAAGSLLLIKV